MSENKGKVKTKEAFMDKVSKLEEEIHEHKKKAWEMEENAKRMEKKTKKMKEKIRKMEENAKELEERLEERMEKKMEEKMEEKLEKNAREMEDRYREELNKTKEELLERTKLLENMNAEFSEWKKQLDNERNQTQKSEAKYHEVRKEVEEDVVKSFIMGDGKYNSIIQSINPKVLNLEIKKNEKSDSIGKFKLNNYFKYF